MDRLSLINYLINQRNAVSYLEVTAHPEQINFIHISCAAKVSTYPHSSDQFFTQNKQSFDIIFIDGIHTEEQVIKDIHNALACLSPDGIIIIHDCMPPDAWHQREPDEYKEGENWNGTVWKAALRIFNESTLKCTLLDMDWGCGIMDSRQVQEPKLVQLPEKLDYELHFPLLLEYKKSVAAYIREQVKVFYHLACMGNWEEVYKEQMLQLQKNGFSEIKLTILGTEENLQAIQSVNGELSIGTEILFHSTDLNYFETPALINIEEYARQQQGYVLYLHSKGVSNPADNTKIKWRRLMMQQLVDNWQSCMLQLPHYDIVGVNWRDMPPTSHFCGNFWYASTNYLRKLAPFKNYFDNPRYPIWDNVFNKRLGCEFWIGSSHQMPRLLSLHCKNADFCNPSYWY